MNITNTTEFFFYDDGAKGALSLIGILISPMISLFFYVYNRRRLIAKGDSVDNRANPFYNLVSGIFLGQFICHVFFKSTDYTTILSNSIMTLFVLMGYIIMTIFEQCGRVCHPNRHYVSPANSRESNLGLNRFIVEEDEYVKFDHLDEKMSGPAIFKVEDHRVGRKMRRQIMVIVLVVMTLVAIIEGFFLIYNQPDSFAGIIVVFLINKILQSIVVYSSFIHARIHTKQGKRARLLIWIFLTIYWTLVLFMSVLPVLIDVNLDAISIGVESDVLGVFYALSGGVMLWLVSYFKGMKKEKTDKQETTIGLILFSGAALLSWTTGLFI